MQPGLSIVSVRSNEALLAQVASFGFCPFTAEENRIGELIRSLRRLQFAVSKTLLRISHASDARPNTLSAKHAAAAFPFHTDFAFRALPPRFILLLNASGLDFKRPTLIARIAMLAPQLQNLVRNSRWN
jgi:hypothetical protein